MKPKTFLLGFAALLVLLAFTVAPVAAVKPVEGNNGNAKFVELVEKTPVETGPYSIVDGGASGKLMYKYEPIPMFVFNAKGLDAGVSYTLLNYNENSWEGKEVILGAGIADEYGIVHIKGEMESELNTFQYPTVTGQEYDECGSKIWLVLTDDMYENQLSNWTPTEYLFETALIPCPVA